MDNTNIVTIGYKFAKTLTVISVDGRDCTCVCSRCKRTSTYDKYNIQNDMIKNCRICKKFRGIEIGVQSERGLQVIGYRPNPENSNDIDVLVRCMQCNSSHYLTKQEFKDNKACKDCKSLKKMQEKPKEKKLLIRNPKTTELLEKGADISDKEITDSDKHTKIVPNSYKDYIKELKKKEKQILKDKGLLNHDHVGEVYNGMIIKAQDNTENDVFVKVQCMFCNEVYKSHLWEVISNKIRCVNCKDAKYVFMCPKCNSSNTDKSIFNIGNNNNRSKNILSITREELFNGGILHCEMCDNDINIPAIAYSSDQADMRDHIINSIDTKTFGNFERIDSNSNLIISSKLAYTGRDEKERFNCYCIKHKCELCLTIEETIGYNHEKCNGQHMKLVPLSPAINNKE